MNLGNDFNLKTNVSNGLGAPIKAFHEVDPRQRMAMRHAFENRTRVAEIAKQFEVSERDVWSAAKNDRSLGGVLDERYWRHGLTVSLGNGLNVSEQQARRRLQYVALRLKRMIWGHNDRRQAEIELIVFKHQWVNWHKKKQELGKGSKDWSEKRQKQLVDKRYRALQTSRSKYDQVGEHWHAVMAVRGIHGWSDQEITDAINEIEKNRKREYRWEKAIDAVSNWKDGNALHHYVGREVKYDGDSYFMMTL